MSHVRRGWRFLNFHPIRKHPRTTRCVSVMYGAGHLKSTLMCTCTVHTSNSLCLHIIHNTYEKWGLAKTNNLDHNCRNDILSASADFVSLSIRL